MEHNSRYKIRNEGKSRVAREIIHATRAVDTYQPGESRKTSRISTLDGRLTGFDLPRLNLCSPLKLHKIYDVDASDRDFQLKLAQRKFGRNN